MYYYYQYYRLLSSYISKVSQYAKHFSCIFTTVRYVYALHIHKEPGTQRGNVAFIKSLMTEPGFGSNSVWSQNQCF